MAVSISVYGKTELVEQFREIGPKLVSAMNDEMKTQMTRLADYIRANKLSGDPLHRRSGRLSRSVSGQSSAEGTRVTGTIGSKGVPYAHVHETGGTFDIPAHERTISMVFGRPVVPHSITVNAYSATFPQRAFLKPSLDSFEGKIRDALRARVLGVLRATQS